MDFEPRYKTLFQILESSLRSYGPRELFGTKVSGRWQWTTYSDFGDVVDRLRGGLVSLGVQRGDRVAIVSNNRVEWAVAAFACYTLGAVFVPLYEAQSPIEWDFVVRECEAKILFVANEGLAVKAQKLLETIPTLHALVVIAGPGDKKGSEAPEGKRVTHYEALLASPRATRYEPAPDDLAVLIYTSGTMGTPKGVPLTHLNIASDLSAIHAVFSYSPSDRSLVFLPWAHVFGQTAELYLLMSCGSSMAFCEGPDKIFENLAEIRPTVLVSVPRVFNKIYLAVEQQLAARPKAIRKVVSAAIGIAAREREGRAPRVHERLLRKLVDRLVFEKVRARFGGRLVFASSGGAALSREVGAFIDSLGITVYEGYGLTETSPVVSTNVPGARRLGTVGRALPGVRVVIDRASLQNDGQGTGPAAGDGEIVVYGPNVMNGYYKRDHETAAVFTADGGFRTGDMGHFDADGYLVVTGRIKEQYKLENGRYVVPSPLEEKLKLSAYVANVMVYGENRPFNVALVVANLAAIGKWAESEHLTLPSDVGALLADSRVRALFELELSRCSASFKGYEAIANFALTATDFTIDNGMLTPKLSLKRSRVVDAYAKVIEDLYRPASSLRASSRPAATGML
jgi:long-chain acyl-CoA synthetase